MEYQHGESAQTPLQSKWLFWYVALLPDTYVVIGLSLATTTKKYGQTDQMTDYLNCHVFSLQRLINMEMNEHLYANVEALVV